MLVTLAHLNCPIEEDHTGFYIQSGARNVIPLIVHNTFLLLQKRLTSDTELILIGWKFVPNEEHVQCDHRFASQPLANEPLHSSQLFDTSLQKARGTTSLCGPGLASKGGQKRPENVAQLRAHIVKLCRALSEDLCRVRKL